MNGAKASTDHNENKQTMLLLQNFCGDSCDNVRSVLCYISRWQTSPWRRAIRWKEQLKFLDLSAIVRVYDFMITISYLTDICYHYCNLNHIKLQLTVFFKSMAWFDGIQNNEKVIELPVQYLSRVNPFSNPALLCPTPSLFISPNARRDWIKHCLTHVIFVNEFVYLTDCYRMAEDNCRRGWRRIRQWHTWTSVWLNADRNLNTASTRCWWKTGKDCVRTISEEAVSAACSGTALASLTVTSQLIEHGHVAARLFRSTHFLAGHSILEALSVTWCTACDDCSGKIGLMSDKIIR